MNAALTLPGAHRRLIAVVRPFRARAVEAALRALGATFIISSEARGYGRQKGHDDLYGTGHFEVSFLPKVRLECVVPAARVEEALRAILAEARTGRIGDGKVFVQRCSQLELHDPAQEAP